MSCPVPTSAHPIPILQEEVTVLLTSHHRLVCRCCIRVRPLEHKCWVPLFPLAPQVLGTEQAPAERPAQDGAEGTESHGYSACAASLS